MIHSARRSVLEHERSGSIRRGLALVRLTGLVVLELVQVDLLSHDVEVSSVMDWIGMQNENAKDDDSKCEADAIR